MRNERFGLWIIGASLLAIATVSLLLVQHQAQSARAQVRNQGVGLVRLLSGMPLEQLRGDRQRSNPLRHLLDAGAGSGLGYALLVDLRGQPLADASAPGTIVPPAAIDPRPADWFGEHVLESPGDGRRVREFFGPVLEGGDLAGFVRLGFFESPFPLNGQLIPLLGIVALPVFLLVPLFYLLMRREVRPLADLARKLDAGTNAGPLTLDMSGELRDFVQRFSQFVEGARDRIRELESERSAAVTSSRMLAYRRDKAEAILQALPEAVIVLDDAGLTTFVNRKVQTLVGADPEVILGHPPQVWCNDATLLAYLSGFGHRSTPSRRAETFEYAPVAAPERRVGLAAFPLFSPQDPRVLLGTLVVLRDATREHQARNAGAEFVAHVSHELKSPLNVISMYSDMLMDDDGQDEAMRVEAINAIHDNVERMADLIRNLLSIAKMENGTLALDRQRVRLNDFLSDILESTTHGARGGKLHFDLRVAPELPSLMLDKGLFSVAVKNLLTNAIKYNRPEGSVVLAAEQTGEDIVIRVADTGIGIRQEDQARVFEKFFRSSASEVLERSGHGLGLFLAHEIVALHHGSLSVKSEPGKGSEFRIVLRKSAALLKETL